MAIKETREWGDRKAGLLARLIIGKADVGQIQTLIEHPDVKGCLNDANKNGFTLLMVAAIHRNIDAFNVLLSHGADISLRNRYGLTATQYLAMPQNELEKTGFEYRKLQSASAKAMMDFAINHEPPSQDEMQEDAGSWLRTI